MLGRLLSLFKRYHKGERYHHFNGKTFFHPESPCEQFNLPHLIFCIRRRPVWPKQIALPFSDHPPERVEGSKMRVVVVGHSTLLIQTQGLNILTDPIWSKNSGPFFWFGTKRVIDPGISFDNLPKIDVVVISHNHYDHLDIQTIKRLWKRDQPRIIAPLGNEKVVHFFYPKIRIETLDWGQHIKVNDRLTAHLEPCHHWSGRHFFDRNKALWGAFVFETPAGNVYFSGDTGYVGGDHFRLAKKKFSDFRLALLPIGAYEPRRLHEHIHLNAEEAVLAHFDLGRPHTIPIHYGIFNISDEPYDLPLTTLSHAMRKYEIKDGKWQILSIGQSWMVPH